MDCRAALAMTDWPDFLGDDLYCYYPRHGNLTSIVLKRAAHHEGDAGDHQG
jgi:hypothetical protein